MHDATGCMPESHKQLLTLTSAVINGACLYHLAASFMGSDAHKSGRFVILSRVGYTEDGVTEDVPNIDWDGDVFSWLSAGRHSSKIRYGWRTRVE